MSPFQYGIDFGIVAGLQAMIGFLEVSIVFDDKLNIAVSNLLHRSLERETQHLQSAGTSLQDASN